jgi:deoxycytidylate deaminase
MSTYAYKDQGKRFSDCEVCLGVFETTKDFCYGTKNCDHYACHDCMRVYLNQEIKNIQRKSYDIIQCPGEECKESFVTDKLVKEVFSAQEAEKWWHMAVSSKAYIKNKASLRETEGYLPCKMLI